jgi:hypothetical protein
MNAQTMVLIGQILLCIGAAVYIALAVSFLYAWFSLREELHGGWGVLLTALYLLATGILMATGGMMI